MGLMDVLKGMQYGPHGAPRSGTGSGTGTGTGSSAGSGTGMSPITMAILGLLAYKALKHVTHYTEVPADGPRSGDGVPGSSGGPGRIGTAPSQGAAPSQTTSDTDIAAPRDSDMGRGWPGDVMPGGRTSAGGTQTASHETGGAQTSAPGSLSDLIKGALGSLLAGSAAGGVMSGGLNDLLKQMQRQGFTDTAESWVGDGPNKTIPPGDLAKVLGADQIEAMMAQSGLSRDELLDGLSRHLPEVVDRLTPDGQVPRHIPM